MRCSSSPAVHPSFDVSGSPVVAPRWLWRSLPALSHKASGFEVFLQAARAYQRRIGSPSIHGLGPCFRVSPHVAAQIHSTVIERCSRERPARALLRLAVAPLQRLCNIAEPRALRLDRSPEGSRPRSVAPASQRPSSRRAARRLSRACQSRASMRPQVFSTSRRLAPSNAAPALSHAGFAHGVRCPSEGFPPTPPTRSHLAMRLLLSESPAPPGVGRAICLRSRQALPPTGAGCLQGCERAWSPFRAEAWFRCLAWSILSWTFWGRPYLGSQRASSVGRGNEVAAVPSAVHCRPDCWVRKPREPRRK